jgi:hypothetical protein
VEEQDLGTGPLGVDLLLWSRHNKILAASLEPGDPRCRYALDGVKVAVFPGTRGGHDAYDSSKVTREKRS